MATAETAAPQKLSPEQQLALDSALQGCNLFITGVAGTGKSFLVKHIVEALRAQGKSVAITASTGFAATQIDGMTLHRFSGVGLGTGTKENLIAEVMTRNKQARDRWRAADVLVVDEVSMIDGELLDKVDAVGRACCAGAVGSDEVYNNPISPLPFGGKQLMIIGDFLQLPPIKKQLGFAFECGSWRQAHLIPVQLTRVFRQSDSEFVEILSKMRVGILTTEARQMLDSLKRPLDDSDGIKPTMLYPHRGDVAQENMSHFRRLPADKEQIYRAVDSDQRQAERLDKEVPAVPELKLRIGTQVLLTTNLDVSAKLANGSRGIVTDFVSASGNIDPMHQANVSSFARNQEHAVSAEDLIVPVVKFGTGEERAILPHTWSKKIFAGRQTLSRTQIPLLHAWAITVHKCQGMTLDRVVMKLDKCFDDGMAYVALSRCRSPSGIQVLGWDPSKVHASQKVQDYYNTFAKQLADAQGWWASHGSSILRKRNPNGSHQRLAALSLQAGNPNQGHGRQLHAGSHADTHSYGGT
ncbi:hypothetical protein WJX73_001993 [Symbiochloris irregularis]|uniref:ATP-dependent DNA helicase n=1 Tax=Symbiochloris irregularis TaxID=706552 RepID=A0AAW1Q246_9CHLO